MRMITAAVLMLVFAGVAHAQNGVDPSDPAGLGLQLEPSESTRGVPVDADSDGNLSSSDSRLKVGALTKRVDPVYPQIARTARVGGTVVLRCEIATDGTVEELNYVSGPPLLMRSAMDAVRQWRYQPTLRDGEPVEVSTKVTIVYTLGVQNAGGAPPEGTVTPNSNQRGTTNDEKPIRVGGNVIAAMLIHQVAPKYPSDAKKKGIEGTVVLHAIIEKDGTIRELKLVSGPSELVDSAMDAVRQWKYRATVIEGKPVAVDTVISVVYRLHG